MVEDVSYVSVSHLTSDALNILNRLNTKKLIPSDGPSKLPRDWRGLANLSGITAQDAENQHQNMLKWILQTWVRNDEGAAVMHQLFRHLETIDRYDIRDDLQDLATANKLVNKEQRWTVELQIAPQRSQDASELLTMDDVDEGAPVEYDALVLFAEEDQDFVNIMIEKMTSIGFRLFTKHSLRPGIMPYRPMTELINSRCRHTILIYSPAFFKSLDDKFYTDYVHARNIVTRDHILIPCVYKECELPTQYKYYFSLYVNTTAYNFWDRLARVVDSGRNPRLTTPNTTSSVRITEVSNAPLKIRNGPLKITNGQVANGYTSQSIQTIQSSQSVQSNQTSATYVSPVSTQTIALPDVPASTLSLSMTTLTSIDSRKTDTTSLKDTSITKKKKSFNFLKKHFGWSRKNKNKKPLLASN